MKIKIFLIFFLNKSILKVNLKCFSFELLKNPEKVSPFPQKYFEMLLTLIIIQNVSTAINQIRMISEGSRDTEDWSTDAENSGLPSQE